MCRHQTVASFTREALTGHDLHVCVAFSCGLTYEPVLDSLNTLYDSQMNRELGGVIVCTFGPRLR